MVLYFVQFQNELSRDQLTGHFTGKYETPGVSNTLIVSLSNINQMCTKVKYNPLDMLDQAIAAEKVGFESISASDHFLP